MPRRTSNVPIPEHGSRSTRKAGKVLYGSHAEGKSGCVDVFLDCCRSCPIPASEDTEGSFGICVQGQRRLRGRVTGEWDEGQVGARGSDRPNHININ